MGVHRCNTKCLTQCSMSMAIPEATGCPHWATTHFVLPQRPPGQQQMKQQFKNAPTLLAILMSIAMLRYVIEHITQWRRSRASLETTGCRHWAHICSNKSNWPCQYRLFLSFLWSTGCKQAQSKRMAPNDNRGMTYWTDGKHSKKIRYLVGGVKLACYCLNNCSLLGII